MSSCSSKKGSLMLTFIIMLAISSIFFSFIYVVTGRSRNLAAQKQSVRAFYIAEAGINKAIWYLTTPVASGGRGDAWRTSATSESFAGGAYTFSISDGPSGSILVVSTGESSERTRTIEQLLSSGASSTASFEYALYSNSTLSMTGACSIKGPAFSKGNVTLTGSSKITGKLDLLAGSSLSTTGASSVGSLNPVATAPAVPTVETSYYDGLLSAAAATAAGNKTISGATTYNLAGGVLYVNGNMNVSGSTRIIGGGTIVVTGSYTQAGACNVASNTTIITGNNIEISGSSIINSGGILFSRNNITLSGAGDITGSVIALNSVNASGSGRTIGLIYSQQGISGARTIVGSVVCKSAASLSGSISITYDPSKIGASIPGIVSSGKPEKLKGSWKEHKKDNE